MPSRHHIPLLVAALAAALAGCQARSGDAPGTRQSAAEDPPAPPPARPIVRAPPLALHARPGDDLVYHLRIPAPHTHYLEVEAVFPVAAAAASAGEAAETGAEAADRANAIEVFMPVWTPGSYLVREFSRHLEDVTATTLAGTPLAVEKVRKNRWRVTAGDEDHVVVRYRVYAREMSVRTNFVDDALAVLNGAPTFLTMAGGETRGHDVTIELPAGWSHCVTALPPHPGGAPHHYLAPDYDTLVDSPIVLGNPLLHTFEVEGVPHRIATFGGGELWDGDRVARDTEAIVRTQARFWGVIPYRDYVFLSVLEDGGGGLEHKASTLMMGNPWRTRTRKDYLRWLGLTSHEFFHTWNVKRLRPRSLGPFDYEREVYTRSLWVVEGITSYYDDLTLRRAGIVSDEEYLELLSKQIEGLETRPGRKVQSLAMSSYDAWIKFYRPDENSANTDISYYGKGAVVGFLLDAEIRRRTGGARSLDDVMRLAYERHGGADGYTAEAFRALAGEVAGSSLEPFFARAVDSTDELDYEPALALFGLRFAAPKPGKKDEEIPGWLGATTAVERGRLLVQEVRRGTPAHDAGVNVGDEILAMDDYRVAPEALDAQLRYYRPGDRVILLVSRRGKLRSLPLTLGRAPEPRFALELEPRPSAQQTARRNDWLAGRP